MAVAPSGTDSLAVYTSRSIVQRYLPTDALAATGDVTPASGKILATDLTDLIREWSRRFDDETRGVGLEVPFPDVSRTNPRLPDLCRAIVTDFVVGECRTILAFGNRKQNSVTHYTDKARKALDDLLEHPKKIGYGQVTCEGGAAPESLTKIAAADGYGKMFANFYQFANRNLLPDTIRFVTSAGNTVLRPDGLPFSMATADYFVESAAESLVWLNNEAQILASIGTGGGVIYRFSWLKLDWGQSHPTRIPSMIPGGAVGP